MRRFNLGYDPVQTICLGVPLQQRRVMEEWYWQNFYLFLGTLLINMKTLMTLFSIGVPMVKLSIENGFMKVSNSLNSQWLPALSCILHVLNMKQRVMKNTLHLLCIRIGSVVYEKVSKALKKKRLTKGIQQASPIAQTSCLEGFHSVLNQFAPKMIAFSYPGIYIW